MMPTLSQLVKIKKDINDRFNAISLIDPIDDIVNTLDSINREHGSSQFINEKINQAIDNYKSIQEYSESEKRKLYSIIDSLDIAIKQESARINQANEYKSAFNGISDRFFLVNKKVTTIIEASISKYIDFHYPGLRLGCKYVGQLVIDPEYKLNYELSEHYSNCLVACDPLYFSDFNDDNIKKATQHFNGTYQRRIRLYSSDDLNKLPQEQFGFIFCWMLLNYADQDSLLLYLNKIYNLLRPGGTVMFSYNNIDLEESAKIAELGLMSAVSKQELFEKIQKIGFQISNHYDLLNDDSVIQMISWAELRKPGDLHTVKLKQVLGEISIK